ncbi:uncharacterized protein UHOR_14164 [Ustilago hordei]|uniref:Uncharacterized protein n=1 Tax=Ustilago hordei TaxID=120017 RepID=I2FSX9_USTHO|nr:uncharacterized protein UHOR_14164 [Ustilago hordei]
MTPRSGVSVDDDEVGGVGDKVGGINTSVQCQLCIASDAAPALSLQRVPSSLSTVQGAPLAPLLSSLSYPACLAPLCLCVNSFDTAPPPCYPACLAPLCLLSGVDSFDTAPPPQDLVSTPLTLVSRAPECIVAYMSVHSTVVNALGHCLDHNILIAYRGQELLDCWCETLPTITDWTAGVKQHRLQQGTGLLV